MNITRRLKHNTDMNQNVAQLEFIKNETQLGKSGFYYTILTKVSTLFYFNSATENLYPRN